MWKKLLIAFLLCASIMAFSTVSHASSGVSVDKGKYEVINPAKRSFTSKNKVTFVNGKAPSGTKIDIKVYGTTDLTRNNFNLHNLPKKDDYIESHSYGVTAGNMGFFDKQLKLVSGINKVIVDFNAGGVPNIEIIILVQPNMAKTADRMKIISIMPSAK